MINRVVLLDRDRAHGATSAWFRWQRITASHRADGFFTIKPSASLTSTRGAAVRMPSRSLRMRLVQMVHARSSTAAYRTAAFVRFVTEVASFSASDKRRATSSGRLAFAKGAVVLVHNEATFTVKIAFDLGTDLLVINCIRSSIVGRWIITRRCLTGAHRATILVLDEVAVQSTVRQFRANFVILRQYIRHEVGLLPILALANRTVILVRAETVVTLHLAIVQRFARLAVRMMIEAGATVRRWWTVRTTFAGIGRYRVLARLAHGSLAGRGSVLVADASDAVVLLPLLAESPRDALVNTVLRLLLGFRPGDRI